MSIFVFVCKVLFVYRMCINYTWIRLQVFIEGGIVSMIYISKDLEYFICVRWLNIINECPIPSWYI